MKYRFAWLSPRVRVAACALVLVLTHAACQTSIEPVIVNDDRVAPTVAGVSPADGSMNVETDARVVVTFSETIDAASIGTQTLVLRSGGNVVPGYVRRDAPNQFVWVPVDGLLPDNARLDATVALGVRDVAGNPMLEATEWTFSTGSDAPPPGTPIQPMPADGATDVSFEPTLAWQTFEGLTGRYRVLLSEVGSTEQPVGSVDEPSLLLAPLAANTTYEWRVESTIDGTVLSSLPWRFTTGDEVTPGNERPSAPVTPVPPDGALAVSPDVMLSWDAATDLDGDTVSYSVYLGQTDDPPLVAFVSSNNYVPDPQLEPNDRYRWRVVADDGRGGRTGGPLWTLNTGLPNDPPPAPQGPLPPDGLTGVVAATASLQWNEVIDPDGDLISYDVYLSPSRNDSGEECTPELVQSNLASPVYTPTGASALMPGTEYCWRVVAKDGRGHQITSSTWTFGTNTPPPAPRMPTPENQAVGIPVGTTLSWVFDGDPDGDEVEFLVYFEALDTDPEFVSTVTATSYVPPQLDFSQTYFWRVEARDAAGETAASDLWLFQTVELGNQPPTAPCDPMPEDGDEVDGARVLLSWSCGTDRDGDLVQFRVYIGLTPNTPIALPLTDFEERQIGPRGFGPGTWYWRVEAIDNRGASTLGPLWNFDVD